VSILNGKEKGRPEASRCKFIPIAEGDFAEVLRQKEIAIVFENMEAGRG
jgi:hypothetical protein